MSFNRKVTLILTGVLIALALYGLAGTQFGNVELNLPRGTVAVEIARNHEDQVQGLSGRDELDPGEGMLFVYPDSRTREFWMKGVPFPIDILWIDSEGVVLKIDREVPPAASRAPEHRIPTRSGYGRYVLELVAGGAQRYGVVEGTRIEMPQSE